MEAETPEAVSIREAANTTGVAIDAPDAADENDRAGTRAHMLGSIDDGAQTRRSDLTRNLPRRINIAARAVQMHRDDTVSAGIIDEFVKSYLVSGNDMSPQPKLLADDRHLTSSRADGYGGEQRQGADYASDL